MAWIFESMKLWFTHSRSLHTNCFQRVFRSVLLTGSQAISGVCKDPSWRVSTARRPAPFPHLYKDSNFLYRAASSSSQRLQARQSQFHHGSSNREAQRAHAQPSCRISSTNRRTTTKSLNSTTPQGPRIPSTPCPRPSQINSPSLVPDLRESPLSNPALLPPHTTMFNRPRQTPRSHSRMRRIHARSRRPNRHSANRPGAREA